MSDTITLADARAVIVASEKRAEEIGQPQSTDYNDLDEVPEATASATANAPRNAAHPARVLNATHYPPS